MLLLPHALKATAMTGVAKASLNVEKFMKYPLSILTFTHAQIENLLFSPEAWSTQPTVHNILNARMYLL